MVLSEKLCAQREKKSWKVFLSENNCNANAVCIFFSRQKYLSDIQPLAHSRWRVVLKNAKTDGAKCCEFSKHVFLACARSAWKVMEAKTAVASSQLQQG
jgi:hypothetical protein